jgi:hypothetical protein
VTNAKKGWVEFSSSLMLPKVHKFIMTYVEVISARDCYEKDFPNITNVWKEKVFLSLL